MSNRLRNGQRVRAVRFSKGFNTFSMSRGETGEVVGDRQTTNKLGECVEVCTVRTTYHDCTVRESDLEVVEDE